MRPKDDRGIALPPPHKRLDCAPQLRQAGAFALATDSRSAIWNSARRIAILDKIIDHVVDGDKVPAWVFKRDINRPENGCLVELWKLAEGGVRSAYVALGVGAAE